jgi:quinol monooxygenase YgiN
MDQTTVTVIVRFDVKEGKLEQFKEVLGELITATRQEPGNLRYELNVSNDNTNVFWLVESWKDADIL